MTDREAPLRKERDAQLRKNRTELKKALKAELPEATPAQLARLVKIAEGFSEANDRAWGNFNAGAELLAYEPPSYY